MPYDLSVTNHYHHGSLLKEITEAVTKLGKSNQTLTIEDLAPVDEFHIGGRVATEHLLQQLQFTAQHHILDAGCGLGGASRFIASTCQSRVSGIDLTGEYIEVGNQLCQWLGLNDAVDLQQGNILELPFDNDSFDGAIMLHVGMNIEDKVSLFSEIRRVLRPGAQLGVYDVMRIKAGKLAYPVPWATQNSTCKLATADEYRATLESTGFELTHEADRSEFAQTFFEMLRAKTAGKNGPPPLSLHTLMQESTAAKIKNMIDNIGAGRISPIEMVARKP